MAENVKELPQYLRSPKADRDAYGRNWKDMGPASIEEMFASNGMHIGNMPNGFMPWNLDQSRDPMLQFSKVMDQNILLTALYKYSKQVK